MHTHRHTQTQEPGTLKHTHAQFYSIIKVSTLKVHCRAESLGETKRKSEAEKQKCWVRSCPQAGRPRQVLPQVLILVLASSELSIPCPTPYAHSQSRSPYQSPYQSSYQSPRLAPNHRVWANNIKAKVSPTEKVTFFLLFS